MSLDPTLCFRVPSRLCIAPTSCAPGTTFPYGGKALGQTSGREFRPGRIEQTTVDMGIAQPRRRLKTQERPSFGFTLEEYDLATLQLFFPYAVGPTNGFATSRFRGGQPSGPVAEISGILLAPYDLRHPALYIPRPLPAIDRMLALVFLQQAYLRFALMFEAGAHATLDAWSIGRLEELVLS